jgi:hypothetical protein
MEEYIINVGEIENLQMINDIAGLDAIFQRAKRNVIGGASVVLVRKERSGEVSRFDELSTPDDLETYRKQVYKYLKA